MIKSTKISKGIYEAASPFNGARFIIEKHIITENSYCFDHNPDLGEAIWMVSQINGGVVLGGQDTKKDALECLEKTNEWNAVPEGIKRLQELRNRFQEWLEDHDQDIEAVYQEYLDSVNVDKPLTKFQYAMTIIGRSGDIEAGLEPAKRTNNINHTFTTHDEVDVAVRQGLISTRSGAAFKARITIAKKATKPELRLVG